MIADLHVHLFPVPMFMAVWEYFETRGWSVHREHVEAVDRTLAAHGVEVATALSYPHKPGVARPLNRFMESVGQRFPRFRPFASVHVEDEDLEDEIRRVFESPHLHGFKFQPLVQRFDVNDRRLDPLYQGCLELEVPLIMHMGTAPISNEFVGFAHFRRLIERYPELRVCVAHMGGFEFDEFLGLLDDHPNMYLDTTMINVTTDLFDTSWRGDAERLARHADRICFGSDWPNVPYDYQEALDSVPRFPLSAEAQKLVRWDNALQFLKE